MLIRPWEKLVLGQKYNEVLPTFPSLFAQDLFLTNNIFFSLSSQLGAVRFDRDLRAITTYLSSQTAFGDVREKFVRLQQIATLLNLDQVRLYSDLFLFVVFASSDGELGRRCGRILQRFWNHVEVKRAGGADSRWTQAIRVTSLPLPLPLSALHECSSSRGSSFKKKPLSSIRICFLVARIIITTTWAISALRFDYQLAAIRVTVFPRAH